MKFSGAILWLAALVAAVLGSALLESGDTAVVTRTVPASYLFASSHTIAQRLITAKPALSHMYASSRTIAQRQVPDTPVLSACISCLDTLMDGRMAVLSTSTTKTMGLMESLATGSPFRDVSDILQALGISTVTSFLGPTPVATPTPTSVKQSEPGVLTLTTTINEMLIVTAGFPLVTVSIPDPQSQIQAPTTSEPAISFAPIASTTSVIAPTSTVNPHVVPSAGSYTYLGCFREGLKARILGEAFFPNDVNTIEKCAAACYPFNYAGAEFGRECWCGNDIKDAFRIDEADNCNMPCAGDSQQTCGGIVALNVYIRKDPASPVPGGPSGSIQTSVASSTSTSSAVSTGLPLRLPFKLFHRSSRVLLHRTNYPRSPRL